MSPFRTLPLASVSRPRRAPCRRIGPALLILAAACGTDDPIYLAPTPAAIEVDPANMLAAVTSSVQLPVLNVDQDPDWPIERMALATQLGLTIDQIPQARRDDYDVSIEWTIKNLSDQPGIATIAVLGASEYYYYDPAMFIIDPMEDEAPPPLMGGVPIMVPALGVISGVFREDHLAEAAQDWDAISRGGVTPQFAALTQWETPDVTGGTGGELAAIPSAAVAALVRIDLTFTADQHMVLEYVLRVRDKHDRLAPFEDPAAGRLVPPSTTAFVPPPPPML
jgi:hypothetical protein